LAESGNKLDREFLRAALGLAAKAEVDYLLYVSDQPLAPEELKGRSLRRKLIYAVTSDNLRTDLTEQGFQAVSIPRYEYGRVDRIKVALIAAAEILEPGETVLCLTGTGRSLDTLLKVNIGAELTDKVSIDSLDLPAAFDSKVVEAIFDIALAIGQEGFEGHPVGTLLVLGDSISVMEKSRQLTLNPFQGISETERNLLDPRIREAVRSFSVLDGAFVVREDGVVLAAGRYLQSAMDDVKIPLGLGARHAAAALITVTTGAIAIVVSQTSGAVRVFHKGEIALEMHPSQRRV
jgi:diadenylate cyclase